MAQPEGWPAPNRPLDNFNLIVVHVMIGPQATNEDLVRLLQTTPAQIAICQCLPGTQRGVLTRLERTLQDITTRTKRAKHDGKELPSLGITRLASGPMAGYVV